MLVAKVQQKPQRKRRNANGLETQHSQKTFDSPSYRTLRRHKLILLEKQLAWAKEVASCPIYNPTRVLDPEYALCRGQRHLEVQRLEGFIAVQHRASLSEKERAEEVSFRLPELERLYDRLADLKDSVDDRFFLLRMGRDYVARRSSQNQASRGFRCS